MVQGIINALRIEKPDYDMCSQVTAPNCTAECGDPATLLNLSKEKV